MKNQRQEEILKLLLEQQTLKTEYLVAHFGVSIETIRRDQHALEQAGLAKKIYGGICLASNPMRMTALENWNVRQSQNHAIKAKLAAQALELIQDGMVIALDNGTTIYELACLLSARKNLTILTASLLIASELSQNTKHKVYCIGGLVLPNEAVCSGAFTQLFLEQFSSVDLFLCSADSLSPAHGIMEVTEAAADVKRQLIRRSKHTAALIDHSKFGKESLFISCKLQDLDTLITDAHAPQQDLAQLKDMGIAVQVVS